MEPSEPEFCQINHIGLTLNFVKKKFELSNLILKGVMEPSEPERGTEAHEVRRSAESI